jgi:UDP-N-acetylglucosamine 2-epimerase
MLVALERVLLDDPPDAVLVRGDTNSTLAGALAAAKLAIPVVHIEAGERCGDLTMPEEINRVMVDHVASLHLCASRAAVARLQAEGIDGAVFVGDVMHDVLLCTRERAAAAFDPWRGRGLEPGAYALATIHRASNTDDPRRACRCAE